MCFFFSARFSSLSLPPPYIRGSLEPTVASCDGKLLQHDEQRPGTDVGAIVMVGTGREQQLCTSLCSYALNAEASKCRSIDRSVYSTMMIPGIHDDQIATMYTAARGVLRSSVYSFTPGSGGCFNTSHRSGGRKTNTIVPLLRRVHHQRKATMDCEPPASLVAFAAAPAPVTLTNKV